MKDKWNTLICKIRSYIYKKEEKRNEMLPKILLVDDIELNRKIVMEGLKDNYEIIEASNGIEALDLLSRNSKIEAIITDLQMPAMNGIEFIKQVRRQKEYRDIAIIANTQYGDERQECRLLELGADEFIFKPNTPEIVEFQVRKALRDRRLRG